MRPVHLLLAITMAVLPASAARRHSRPAQKDGANFAASKHTRQRNIYVGVGDAFMPYILNGEGAVTKIRFLNMENEPVEFDFFFVGDDGFANSVELKDLTKVSSIRATIPANGATTIETSGRGDDQVSWAFFDAGKSKIATTVSVELNDGGFINGSSYPASNVLERVVRVPFDNTTGSDSGINFVNLDDVEAVLTVTVRDIDGNQIYLGTIRVPDLGAGDFYPIDVTDQAEGIRGSIEVAIPSNSIGGVAVNGIRFFDKGGIDLYPGFAMPLP
ncbi:MAG: hypothetical protein HY820_44370 [Acidobacteria bacterium]|nr:hypothetical protein [Acidobacteriota bacterium]